MMTSPSRENLDLSDIFAHVYQHRQEFLDRLIDNVRRPSISAYGQGIGELEGEEEIGSPQTRCLMPTPTCQIMPPTKFSKSSASSVVSRRGLPCSRIWGPSNKTGGF